MNTTELNNLTENQLKKLQLEIDAAIALKQQQELLSLKLKIDEWVDQSPYTLEDVLEARPVKKPVLPKYRNPNNTNETWTGRGRKPLWLVKFLEDGGTLDSAKI